MLYGYRETVDNRIATLVVAADTRSEYDDFLEVAKGQANGGFLRGDGEPANFLEIYTSIFMQHLVEDLYKGYKQPVHVFYHSDEEQREAFIKEFDILEVKTQLGRDRQSDMIFAEKKAKLNAEKALRDAAEAEAEARGEEFNGDGTPRTIEEIYGLDKEDRFDRRSEEQKKADEEMAKKIKEMRKQGKLSGDDSFSGGKYGDKNKNQPDDGDLHVTDIVGDTTADGGFDINNIRAVKIGGQVDEALKEQNQREFEEKVTAARQGKRVFAPEDFAAVLKGDGSADHLDVKGDHDIRLQRKPMERPSLSDAAEAARREYQEEEQRKLKERAKQLKRENDIKAKAERDKGIFRGVDLGGDDDVPVSELPEAVQSILKDIGVEVETIPVKDYPYNSELAGKILLPVDGVLTPNPQAIVGGTNIKLLGTVSMGEPAVMVVEKENSDGDGWVVYQKRTEEGTATSLVHIR